MNIQQIRECLLNLENETILNVSYQLGKRYGVLTIMAKDKDGIYFWEICKEPEDKTIFLLNERKTRTNRDAVHSIGDIRYETRRKPTPSCHGFHSAPPDTAYKTARSR